MIMIKKYMNDKNICFVMKYFGFFFEMFVDKGNIILVVRYLNVWCEIFI